MKTQVNVSAICGSSALAVLLMLPFLLALNSCGGYQASGPPPALPVVSVSANPASIAPGSSCTLTVAASNANQVTLTGSDGSSYKLNASGGTKVVSPSSTTTYTAQATGAGGSKSATAKVSVIANLLSVAIAANPATVVAGSPSTLTVTATNATQVDMTGTDGSSYTFPNATGGTYSVTPAATTSYTVTVTAVSGATPAKANASATVTVTPKPAAVSINASPATVIVGNSSLLSVTATNAVKVLLAGSDGSSYTFPQNSGGTVPVSPQSTTTYTATATGRGGTPPATAAATVTVTPVPTSVALRADPTTVITGNSSTLTVSATSAASVTITGSDGSSYTLPNGSGGTQSITPTDTTTYTATATSADGTTTATAMTTVNVTQTGSVQQIDHVIFMLQENHTFDNYFGMLNPYRVEKGWNVGDDGKTYTVDGIDDKLKEINNQDSESKSFSLFKLVSSCIDEVSSAWQASYFDVSKKNVGIRRPIAMDGFVIEAESFAKYCSSEDTCAGAFTDLSGRRAMGYYDQDYLNYYYYMASQFALSDRWFSPVASYSINNRIATFTGGTTQGLVKGPGTDRLPQLNVPNIFQELDQAKVSWKIYYTVTQGYCLDEDDCPGGSNAKYPATNFSNLAYSTNDLRQNPSHGACSPPLQPSSVVGDKSNSFCIDPNHIAPLSTYFSDLNNGTLPSFAFIEAGYGNNDEHPGSGQSILLGQAQVANVINALMSSYLWSDSVFFFSYDEGGGTYDHVPPVPGHSNIDTDKSLGNIPDISTIAVNPDKYFPCVPAGGTPTTHCDLSAGQAGSNPEDVAAVKGFAAQLGFRLPNFVVSPFSRRHYVSHIPMDHTAIIKFVEDRFIGSGAHLTARDAAQPNLLNFFDFNNAPWATPPTPPTPVSSSTLGFNPCTPNSM